MWRPFCTEKERHGGFQEEEFVIADVFPCRKCAFTDSIHCLENRDLVFVVGLKKKGGEKRDKVSAACARMPLLWAMLTRCSAVR